MILANHGTISSSGSLSYDADALAFITAASITDDTQKTAVNTLVTDLKNANIWTKTKALYPFVGGSATSHKFNLKDPRDLNEAYRITFNGGFTHSSTGVLPNGSNAYGNTNLIPSTALSATDAHQFFYFRTSLPISHQAAYGCETSGINRMSFYPFAFNIGWISDIYDNSDSRLSVNSGNSTGAVMMTRANANSHKIFRNNVQIASTTNATTGTRPSIPYIFSSYNVNGQNLYPDSNELAFGSIGDGLTDAEATALYNAVQTFQTALGRQV